MTPAPAGGEQNVYRVAIDTTIATLALRARRFRALILAVSVGILGPFVWALIARSVAPLTLLVLVFAIVGGFFWLDALIMNRWRARLFQPWQRRELDFMALAAAVQAIPGLPVGTLAAMLASLPSSLDLVRERELTSGAREELVAEWVARDRRQAMRLLVKMLGALSGGVAIGYLLLQISS